MGKELALYLVMLAVVGATVWIGKENASEYKEWQGLRKITIDNIRLTEKAYSKARLDYAYCLGDQDRFHRPDGSCYALRMDLDDAHRDKVRARERLRALPKMPRLYFNGYFLKKEGEQKPTAAQVDNVMAKYGHGKK